ncbi:hypothetical protein [Saccharopolyspora spinosa]|uniref:Immunity protein 21 of polymorphic toxin system n=1 Tax=Saccharopolyspora spinosa TaxID=60894 RepID=A0A2N3Y1T7_SACSN|nr:hypothetical protein [Saccharopolyspora spinosa]PKW16850.1 hypothetical protein A8926_4746 [Saccharopolyspora spinosa]
MPDKHGDVALSVRSMDGQYHIRSLPGMNDAWPISHDGLFVGEDNWVAVLCGTQFGPIELRVRKHDTTPEEIDQGWDMSAEWSLDCAEGRLTIQDIYSSDPPKVVDVACHVSVDLPQVCLGSCVTHFRRLG